MATQDETTSAGPMKDILVPMNVPRVHKLRAEWIKTRSRQSIQPLAIASKRAKGIPDLDDQRIQKLLIKTDQLLAFFETELDISPAMKNDSKVDETLKLIFQRHEFYFPENIKQRAQALYKEWDDNRWGEREVSLSSEEPDSDPDHDGDETSDTPTSLTSPALPTLPTLLVAASTDQTATIRQPPANHPIWGLNGIMHKAMAKIGRSKTLLGDRRYPKIRADIGGHNGLVPGAWFPYQIVALQNGAHGERIAGIAGNTDYGAFSIIVAGSYSKVDQDVGDTIYYSGPGSQKNKNTDEVYQSKGNAVLQRSLDTRHPVRVLRAAKRNAAYAPDVGIRYDGLYRVTMKEEPQKNSVGGLYVRYVLQRLLQPQNQESLDSIVARSPTQQQKEDFRKVWNLW